MGGLGSGVHSKLSQEWIDNGNLEKMYKELAEGRPQRFVGLFIPDIISEMTFYNWRNAGKQALKNKLDGIEISEQEERYMLFLIETEKGIAEYEAHLRKSAEGGALMNDKSWACYITIAERRFPGLYGRRDVLKHEGGEDFAQRGFAMAVAEFRKRQGENEIAHEGDDEN